MTEEAWEKEYHSIPTAVGTKHGMIFALSLGRSSNVSVHA